MTVKELKKILETIDEDKNIYVINPDTGMTYTTNFEIVEGMNTKNIYFE